MGKSPTDVELRKRADAIVPHVLRAVAFRKQHMPFMRTPAHWDVFAFFIKNHTVESVKIIALHAEIDAKTAKRILAEFEDAGIIERLQFDGDRRFKRFSMTNTGLELIISYWGLRADGGALDTA